MVGFASLNPPYECSLTAKSGFDVGGQQLYR
jgi:hypothetical protein